MSGIKLIKTKCPNCGELSMSAVRFSDKLALVVQSFIPLNEEIIDLSIPTKIKSYCKACSKCGYMAYFIKDLIDIKGEL